MQIELVFDEGSSKEDSFLIKDNIFGVFDGANSLDNFVDIHGKKGGLIAAQIARDEFYKNDAELKEIAIRTNKKIKEKMIESKVDINRKTGLWVTTVSVVRLKEKFFEWAQISDSLIIVIYKDNSFKLLVDDYDHDREALMIWKELAKQKKENIREIINKGPLIESRNKMSELWGVLNGEEKAINFLKTGIENLEDVKHILIFSDGLILPKKDPAKSDNFKKFVKLFLKGGLKKVKEYVRAVQTKDPKCWTYPRYKKHDDITGIAINFCETTTFKY